MNINTVRTIDYWAGTPLCFVLSVIHTLRKLLGLCRTPSPNPKKILFIELSEMGSTVLAYSAMKKAKELFPTAQLYFLIFEENKHSVHLLNIIPPENVLTIRSKSFLKLTVDTLRTFFIFRRKCFDISVDLELFSRYSTILSYLTNAPRRTGFYKHHWEGLYRGNFQTHKVAYNSHTHISLNFLALVHALTQPRHKKPFLKQYIGHTPPTDLPRINFGNERKKAMWQKLQSINPTINSSKTIILLNPDAGEHLPLRAWPLEKYAHLTKKLLENKNTYVLLTGLPSSRKKTEYITNTVANQRCINLAGQTQFTELIDLFNLSTMLITNDSGPAHFAALTPIKIVVFFGPETPVLYAPLTRNKRIIYSHYACSPCLSAFNHRKTSCTDNQCLKTISVETVHHVVTNFLNNDNASTA